MNDLPPDKSTELAGRDPQGGLRGEILLLALPVLGEQLLIYCVGLFDTFLAGRISTEATSAIGVAAYVSWLGSLLFSLVAIGTTALVARHWGARDFLGANRFFNQSLPLAAAVGVVTAALIWSVAPLIAYLQDMEGETFRIVVRYLRIDACGYVFWSFSVVAAAALRGTGDTRSPMLLLGIVNILNIVVSTTLVFGYGGIAPWGVDGIVAGTVVARTCGGLLMLAALVRGRSGLKIQRADVWPRLYEVRRILRIGIPGAADGGLTWFGHFLFLMIIAQLAKGELKDAIFAAHVIGIQVEALTYLPATAWGTAAATLIGQSLGAQQPERAMRAGHQAVAQGCLLAFCASITYFLGAPAIYGLMHTSPQVHEIGVPALRFLALFQVPLALGIIYVQALRGAGDTRYPMLFSICGVLLVRVPLAYLCGIVLQGGLLGAWIGMCADNSLRALLAAVRFTRGKWLRIQV